MNIQKLTDGTLVFPPSLEGKSFARLQNGSAAASHTFNPLADSAQDLDFVMNFLDDMAGGKTQSTQLSKAREVLSALIASGKTPNMLIAIQAFEVEPELATFAAALRKVALPGAFGQYFPD